MEKRMDTSKLRKKILVYLRRRDNKLVTLPFIVNHVNKKNSRTVASVARIMGAIKFLMARTLVIKTSVLSSDGNAAYRSTIIGKPKLPGLNKKLN